MTTPSSNILKGWSASLSKIAGMIPEELIRFSWDIRNDVVGAAEVGVVAAADLELELDITLARFDGSSCLLLRLSLRRVLVSAEESVCFNCWVGC